MRGVFKKRRHRELHFNYNRQNYTIAKITLFQKKTELNPEIIFDQPLAGFNESAKIKNSPQGRPKPFVPWALSAWSGLSGSATGRGGLCGGGLAMRVWSWGTGGANRPIDGRRAGVGSECFGFRSGGIKNTRKTKFETYEHDDPNQSALPF